MLATQAKNVGELNSGPLNSNSLAGKEEDSNPGPNHWATPPPTPHRLRDHAATLATQPPRPRHLLKAATV